MIQVTPAHVKDVLDRPIEIASKGNKQYRYLLVFTAHRLAFEITRRSNATAKTTLVASYGEDVLQNALDHYNGITV